MTGLADAFRTSWPPPQPRAIDPAMPVPQLPMPPMDPRAFMMHPLYRQTVEPPSRMMPSSGFADFLRSYYLNRSGI